MFCEKCGKEVNETVLFCSSCGFDMKLSSDKGNLGWGVLGFIFPILGIILYFIWRKDKTRTARIAFLGSIIGFIIVLQIIFFLIT